MQDINICLTQKEVLFLAALLGSKEFLGLENTLFSLTEEEIKKEWNKIQGVLEEKQFIEVNFDGSILIDEFLHAVLSTCCFSNIYIVLNSYENRENIREFHYYITEYFAIEMTLEKGTDNVILTVRPTIGNLVNSIYDKLQIKELPIKYSQKVSLSEKILEEVKEKITGNEANLATDLLRSCSIEEAPVSELIELLKEPKGYFSILLMEFKEGNAGQANESIFVQSPNQIWRFTSSLTQKEADEAITYEFIPRTIHEVKNNILEVLEPVNAVYVYGREEEAV